MNRDIFAKLRLWRTSDRRKPLILRGARQVGKTFALDWFAKTHYRNTIYVNFDKNREISEIFTPVLEPAKIIENLSLYYKQKIDPIDTLIVFDEIQESNVALSSLKYFAEDAPQYHVCAAGSLLGIKLAKQKSFPVGKVNFLDMYPLSFLEFLDAVGEERLRKLIETKVDFTPIADPMYRRLIELLKIYFVVGGMPEAVRIYSAKKSFDDVREIHLEILKSYKLDFVKHSTPEKSIQISAIWQKIPAMLAKENKKFVFSAVKKSARANTYEGALQWLRDAGLVYNCYAISAPKLPLQGYTNDIFKVYPFDTGLLTTMSDLEPKTILSGSKIFVEFNGSLTENFVAQHLLAGGNRTLTYWRSDNTAEVDFICANNNSIWPLEVKSDINTKSKSLAVFDGKYFPKILSRTNLLNFNLNGRFGNYPLYAVSKFPSLFQLQEK